MRICFVTHGDIKTLATVKRATGMAQPLVDAGHQVFIILQDCQGNRERLALECPGAVPLFFTTGSVLEDIRQKRALLRQCDPDVVWVCAVGARNWVFRWRLRSKPIMLVEHSELQSSFKDIPFLRRAWEWCLEQSTVFSCHGQICASRFLEHIYVKRMTIAMRRKPILYSPYAFTSDVLISIPEIVNSLKCQYNSSNLILYMGSIDRAYGIFDLLNAMLLIKKSHSNIQLGLMGGGEDIDSVRTFIEAHHLDACVKLLGYVPENHLGSYFKVASVFVSPLHNTVRDWARCPSKLFMYAPFRKPIVTCRIGEAYELLGEDGFYYEPGDVSSLSSCLQRAVDASQNWSPSYDGANHTWNSRVDDFLIWLRNNWYLA